VGWVSAISSRYWLLLAFGAHVERGAATAFTVLRSAGYGSVGSAGARV